jgi:chromosome segregation ATPase
MRRRLIQLFLVAAVFCFPSWESSAASSDNEARLRESLRSVTIQLRALEDERAVLQAKQMESGKEVESLRKQVEELKQQLAESAKKADYERAVGEFNRRLSAQNETISNLGETLEKWKGAYNEAVLLARSKEAERGQLAIQLESMTKQVALYKEKNAELFKIGTEILNRYAGMGIGEAMTAREPFIGYKRVQLQNIVQDYQDKLLDGKVTP